MDRQIVVKSNHIIEASYRLSVAEQRVILSAVSQVRRDQPVTDEILYSVTAAEIAQLCGTDPKTAYRDLQAAAERLQTRRVTLLLEPDGVTIRTKRRRVTCWVQTVDYIDQEGRIEMRFGKDILPYLTGLQREFTRYALSDVAKMTSAYGIRLYEVLVQWPEGHRVVEVADLRRWLQLEDRYPLMADLRRWLARLHEDINLTSVFVTHDQEEAMEVADRIVVMNKGVIEQIGSPGEVYENPASDFVYHFLGDSNRLHIGEDQHVLFRPHEVSLSRHEIEDHHAAQVRDIRPLGATTRVTLKVEGQSELIEVEVVKDHDSLTDLARGETLFFKPKVWQKA